MGTQPSTNESDYRLYARPKPGESGDGVEVVADGGEQAPHRQDGGEFSDQDMAGAAGRPAAAATPPARFNPYLAAAWAVVALMLGVGLFWLFGTSQMSVMYGNNGGMTRKDLIVVNFQSTGMYLLPFGLAAAIALLTVQAVGYRRGSRD